MHKTLSLIIGAVLVYTLVQMKMQPSSEVATVKEQQVVAKDHTKNDTIEQPNTPLTGNFLEKTLSKIIINALRTKEGRTFFENILQPLDNSMNNSVSNNENNYSIIVNRDLIQPLFKVKTVGGGTEGPAICGHIVTLHYQLMDIGNNLLAENTKTFTLGSKSVLPALDVLTVGMMIGQTKEAVVPAQYVYFKNKTDSIIPGVQVEIDSNAFYKINIVLQSILPPSFIISEEVKVFDDEIAYKTPLLCGDKLKLDAKVTRLSNGKILYNSKDQGKKLEMKIGDLNYPLIFAYALNGKAPVGTRTVISKSKYFKGLATKSTKIINLDQLQPEEYLMLELSNFNE